MHTYPVSAVNAPYLFNQIVTYVLCYGITRLHMYVYMRGKY